MRPSVAVLPLLISVVGPGPRLAGARTPRPAHPAVPADTLVDILGLRDWTAEEVEAALQRYVPGVSLASAACAIILRDSVGFDAASAMVYPEREDRPAWVLITVVEPGRGVPPAVPPPSTEELPTLPPGWRAIDSMMTADRGAAAPLQDPAFLLTDTAYAFGRAASASALGLRARLRTLRTEEDRARASVLIRMRDLKARTLAAAILSNFPERDETWSLLLTADVGWHDSASGMADAILASLARSERFTVDWSGSEGTLRSALSGWNPFALPTVLSVLVQTHADRDEVTRALREQPDLVLAYLSAENPFTPAMARSFLTYLAGEDLGPDAADWRSWLNIGVEAYP